MDKFRLVSPYKATGDQPEAIEALSEGVLRGDRKQSLVGVTGSGKTFTMASIIEKVNRPTLVLAHNKTLAAQLCSEFREFFPDNAVSYFVSYYDYYQPEAYIPGKDLYIEKDSLVNDEIDRLRHSATSSLFERRDVIIVASVSCIYSLGDPSEYKSLVLAVREGMAISREELMRRLIVRIAVRSRDFLDNRLHQRLEVRALIFHIVLRDAVAGRRVDDREVELIVIGIEFHEELEDLIVDIVHALVRLIDLVDDDNRLQLLLQGLAQDVLRLRHRAFEGIDEQENAVDHVEDTLDLAAEVSVARGVDDVDLDAVVHDGRVLRENRDAALALDIARVHDAFSHLLIRAEYMALLQHGIDQRRLAVVDVCNNRDIAELIISHHTHSV